MPVLVVGAGLAGLSTTYWLSKEGYDVVLVEKTPYLGGQLRTLSYMHNGEKYLFDWGPHLVDIRDEIWKNFMCNIEKTISAFPKESVKFTDFDLKTPIDIDGFFSRKALFLLKHGPSFLGAKVFGRKETNLENKLVNQYGNSFYRNYVKSYMTNFWKTSPRTISKDYGLRVRPRAR